MLFDWKLKELKNDVAEVKRLVVRDVRRCNVKDKEPFI